MLHNISLLLLGGAAMLTAQALWRFATTVRAVEPDPAETARDMNKTDLSEAVVRDRLSRYLKALGITGDANIRNGFVVETIPPTDLGDIAMGLRAKINTLLGHIQRGQMQGRDLYVAWKSESAHMGQGVLYRMADIEIDDLGALVVLAERVAEDRRRSRSLYKGLTDSEIASLARAALTQIKPDMKAEIRAGNFDNTAQMAAARAAIEYLYSVKGAGT